MTTSNLRVAVVTEGTVDHGSSWLRGLQFLPHLEKHFAEVRGFPAAPPGREPSTHPERARFFIDHARRYRRRGLELQHELRRFDVVLVVRGMYPLGPAGVARTALAHFDGRVVLDLDDNVFATPPSLSDRSRAARWLYGSQQTRLLLDRADAVVASTTYLAGALPTSKPVAVLPTIPDVSTIGRVSHSGTRTPVIGWVGNAGNLQYLDPLRDAIGAVTADGVASFETMSSRPWSGPSVHRQWSRARERAWLATVDIGIMPLPLTPYTEGKAGFKLLLHMAAGAPVLASPVGVNRDIVEASVGGYLCDDVEDWESRLRDLARDREQRRRLGANGYAYVREMASLPPHVSALAAVLSGR